MSSKCEADKMSAHDDTSDVHDDYIRLVLSLILLLMLLCLQCNVTLNVYFQAVLSETLLSLMTLLLLIL